MKTNPKSKIQDLAAGNLWPLALLLEFALVCMVPSFRTAICPCLVDGRWRWWHEAPAGLHVTGTAGQPDAGVKRGGDYAVNTGCGQIAVCRCRARAIDHSPHRRSVVCDLLAASLDGLWITAQYQPQHGELGYGDECAHTSGRRVQVTGVAPTAGLIDEKYGESLHVSRSRAVT